MNNLIKRISEKLISFILLRLPLRLLETYITRRRGFVILMYHSTTATSSDYTFSTSSYDLDTHLDIINRLFEKVSIPELVEKINNGYVKSGSAPLAAITFDDGYANNYRYALPILRKYDVPFTVFLTTNFISSDHESFLDWTTVNEFKNSPLVHFGSHGITHANLKSLTKDDQIREISESKRIIEQKIGIPVTTFAYPSGAFDSECLRLTQANYDASFIDRSSSSKTLDMSKIPRISIDGRNNDRKRFLATLVKGPFNS